nr:hypothetical protein [Tanacetum cinerariifolium]
MPSGPNNVNVGVIFGVLLMSLKDIDDLTKSIEEGEYEDVMLRMTIDKQKAIMDTIVAVREKFLAEVMATSNMSSATVMNNSMGLTGPQGIAPKITHIFYMTGLSIELPLVDSPIIRLVLIQSKPNPYARATGASTFEPSKGKANFRLLYSKTYVMGRSIFAWRLIDINEDDVLKDSLAMVVNKRKNGKYGSNVNSTKRSGKFGWKSIKLNVKYVPKAPVSVSQMRTSNVVNTLRSGLINAPATSKNQPSKGMLNKESEEEFENVFDGSVNLLSSAKSRATTFPVEKAIMAEEVDKMLEGEEEEDESDSYYFLLLSQDDPSTRLEPVSHTKSLKEKNDNDDQLNVDALIRRAKYLKVVVAIISRKNTYMVQNIKKNFLQRSNVDKLCSKIAVTLNEDVPKVTSATVELSSMVSKELIGITPQQFEAFLNIYMQNHVINLQSSSSALIPYLQQQLYMKMKNDPQSQVADPYMWKDFKAKFKKSYAPSESCIIFFCKRDHDEHPNDNALHEGEKGTKNQKTTGGSKSAKDSSSSKQLVKESQTISFVQQKPQEYDGWSDIQEIDEDEEISEEASPTFLNELKSLGDKKVVTIVDHKRTEATLKDMLSTQFKNAE